MEHIYINILEVILNFLSTKDKIYFLSLNKKFHSMKHNFFYDDEILIILYQNL